MLEVGVYCLVGDLGRSRELVSTWARYSRKQLYSRRSATVAMYRHTHIPPPYIDELSRLPASAKHGSSFEEESRENRARYLRHLP